MQRIICIIFGGVLSYLSLMFGIAGIIILLTVDVSQGKVLGFLIALFVAIVLGIFAVKLLRIAKKLEKEKKDKQCSNERKTESIVLTTTATHLAELKPQINATLASKTLETELLEASTIQQQEVPRQIINVQYKEDRNYPKCNCDGCPKQDYCEYGHIIYDEIEKTRMSLFDKYMMLHAFDVVDDEKDINIATNEELHDKKLLLRLDKDVLKNTLYCLQERKKSYLSIGKCGRAYFNFMKMGDEIALVKEVLRDYDAYYKRIERIDSIKPFILEKLENNGNLLQKDIFAEYIDVGKGQVSKVIEQLISDKIITKEKFGNTYMINKV